jgi:hypothetical protein
MEDVKQPGPQTETPWTRMLKLESVLDSALTAIDGGTPESAQARTYLVAQIEALRWARKQYDQY